MDYIKRFTTREGVRMSIAVTTDTVETARVRHDLWPVATAALGRAMTGALLLAGDFKNHENVSLRIKGDGPLGVVHVDAFSDNTELRRSRRPRLSYHCSWWFYRTSFT